MSVTGRWVDLVYKAATGGWKGKIIIAPMAAAVFLSIIACFVLLSLSMDRWLDLPRVSFHHLTTIVGLCLIVLGFFLMLLSIAYFARVRGTPVPFFPPPTLITKGPYRFARNPMLTGIFMQLFGLGAVLGSISLMFIFTPLFVLMNAWELKKVEEPELTKRLGNCYVEYKNRVPMFFPSFTKHRK